MPTTIYTSKKIGSVGHAGKSYEVVDGAVDVPDDAVAVLCEAHGFTEKPQGGDDEAEKTDAVDVTTLNLKDLINYGNEKFDLGLTNRTSKADALEAVQAAIAKGK